MMCASLQAARSLHNCSFWSLKTVRGRSRDLALCLRVAMAHLTPSLARSVAQLLMALVLVDFSPRAQGRRCPTLAAQQVGGDLDLGHFSAYLDDEYFSAGELLAIHKVGGAASCLYIGSGSGLGGRVELISDGEVSATFSSASSDPFPSRLSPLLVYLQLNTTAPQKVGMEARETWFADQCD